MALLVLAPATVHAQNINLAWDASTTPEVAGYSVNVGLSPGTAGQTFDVGPATSFTFTQAVPGTRYYFSVRAYDAENNTSLPSNTVSSKINVGPSMNETVAPAAAVGFATSLQLSATDDGDPLSYTATGLPAGLSINPSTGRISGTPTTAGTRTVNVTVSDGEFSATGSFGWTINPRLALATLSSSVTSPQLVGSTVTFTTGGTGGLAPYQYKWWLYNGSSWVVARDWGTGNTYSWTPQAANANYIVAAWGRSAGSQQDAAEGGTALSQMSFAVMSNPLRITSLTADRTSPQAVGTTVTFSAAAAGGTAPYQFKFWVYNGISWSVGRNWSTSSTFGWTPQTVGTGYLVAVWSRSTGGVQDGPEGGTALAQVPFAINGGTAPAPLVVTSVTADRSSPQPVGTTITFTANATGGTSPRQFKWWVYNGAFWVVLREWGTSNTVAWTPQVANAAYIVAVWARNAGGVVDGPQGGTALNQLTFGISGGSGPAPLALTSFTANRTTPQPAGTTTTFTASVTGGTAPYQFKWWVFDGTTWWVVSNWSTSSTYSWTPTFANANYVVAVWARNNGSVADAPASPSAVGSMAFGISGVGAPAPLVVTDLTANRAAPRPVGTTTVFTATVSGSTAPYQYKWWLFDGVVWRVVQNWSGDNTYYFTPTAANGNYVVAVWARGAGNTQDGPEQPTAVRSVSFPITP